MDAAASPNGEAPDDAPVHLPPEHLAALEAHYEQQFGGPPSIRFTRRFPVSSTWTRTSTRPRSSDLS